MKRNGFVVVLGFVALLAGCSRGSSALAPISAIPSTPAPGGATATPTAAPSATPTPAGAVGTSSFLAAITPAPGYPSPVAVDWTPNPTATAPPAPLSTPRVGTVSLSEDDLETLSPPDLYTALKPDVVVPQQTMVVGTITAFRPPDGIVITTADDLSIDPATSQGLVDLSDPQPVTLTLHVSGSTIDGVPGGFARLAAGDAVLAGINTLGNDAAALYLTSVGGAGGAYTSAARRSSPAQYGAIARVSSDRRQAAVQYANFTSFRMEGKSPKSMSGTFPFGPACTPAFLPQGAVVCVQGALTFAFGSYAEFPMFLNDASNNPLAYVVDTANPLPLVIDNDPSLATPSKVARYSIAALGILSVSGTLTGNFPVIGSRQFSSTKVVKVGIQTSTARLLPGNGASAPVDTLNQLAAKFDALAFACLALNKLPKTPNPIILALIAGCTANNSSSKKLTVPVSYMAGIADTISGGDLTAQSISLSNASPMTGSNLVFSIDTELPPANFSVTPQRSMQGNIVPQGVDITGMSYGGDDAPVLTLDTTFGLAGGGLSVESNIFHLQSALRSIVPLTDVLKTMRNVSNPTHIQIMPIGPRICGTVTSGNAFLGMTSSCSGSGAIDFEFCRNGSVFQCPAEASGMSGTVAVNEPGYTGPFTVMDGGTAGPMGGGCENGTTQTYAVNAAPRSASGPNATFTISIGALQTPGRDAGCNVFIVDGTGHYVQIALQFISYQ